MSPAEANSPYAYARELAEVRLLTASLERLSADSRWAHRASGLRGSLLRALQALEYGQRPAGLPGLIDEGFTILTRAAAEIEIPDWGD